MRLYEYESKTIYKKMEIAVPDNGLADNTKEAMEIANKIGYPIVLKAQVLQGGRGKAGLVLTADNDEELKKNSDTIFSRIQNDGKLLVEKKMEANVESYIGITIDDITGKPVMIINKHGGVEIENIARDEKPPSLYIDVSKGIELFNVQNLAKEAGFKGKVMVNVAGLAYKMYLAFIKYDMELIEINPVLINAETNEVWAADAKVIIDDYAMYRQPEMAEIQKERRGRDELNKDDACVYVDLGGNIGILSGGASNTMMLCDCIKYLGGEPANFLDTPGSNSYEKMVEMFSSYVGMFNTNDRIKVIFINFTLTAQPLENYAATVADAMRNVGCTKPVIACIRAVDAATMNMSLDEAYARLEEAGAMPYKNFKDAVKTAVELSKEG